MKTIFLIVFAICALLTTYESKAWEGTCPDGFTSSTITFTYGDCEYSIEVCALCPITNGGDIYVWDIWRQPGCDDDVVPPTELYGAAVTFVKGYVWSEFCEAGPCPANPAIVHEISKPVCVAVENVLISAPSTYQVRYLVCDRSAKCVETYTVCLNHFTTPPTKIFTTIGTSLVGTPTCTITTEPNWNSVPYTNLSAPWTSPCYLESCP